LATSYAKFAASEWLSEKRSKAKPFQNLFFLIRDWTHTQDYNYGMSGGALYLAQVLQQKPDQSPSLKSVRKHIQTSFDNVYCFLLPHPGFRVVENHQYDGRWSELDGNFKHQLEDLIDWLLKPRNLKMKRILNAEVTGRTFAEYTKSYLEMFQSSKTPVMSSIYDITVERQLANLLQESLKFYQDTMSVFSESYSENFTLILDVRHEQTMNAAVTKFRSQPKIGSKEQEANFEELLKAQINEYYKQWKENVLNNTQKIHLIEEQKRSEVNAVTNQLQTKLDNQNEEYLEQRALLQRQQEENERNAQNDMLLKDEEKEAAIQLIKTESEAKLSKLETEKAQLIKDQTAEREKMRKEITDSIQKAQQEINELRIAQENRKREIEQFILSERKEHMIMLKQQAEERRESQKIEKERADQLTALDRRNLEEIRKIDREQRLRDEMERKEQREQDKELFEQQLKLVQANQGNKASNERHLKDLMEIVATIVIGERFPKL